MSTSKKKLGEHLVDEGIISEGTIEQALKLQRKEVTLIDDRYRRLGNLLLLIKAIQEDVLVEEHIKNQGLPENFYVATTKYMLTDKIINTLPLKDLQETETIILEIDDTLRRITLGSISLNKSDITTIKYKLNKKYPNYSIEVKRIFEVPYKQWIDAIAKEQGIRISSTELQIGVEEKLKTLFRDAIESRTTDITIAPTKDGAYVKFFIDQGWHIYRNMEFDRDEAREVLNYLLTQSNIAHVLTQEITIDFDLAKLGDFDDYRGRGNVIDAHYGALINIRLLSNKIQSFTIKDLGYTPKNVNFLNQMVSVSKGILLITGPTNSGKNTSILAVLSDIRRSGEIKKIVSIEAPVEAIIEGVTQTSAETDEDFVKVSVALTRQTPQIIYMAEIRDKVTADNIHRIANTGSFVLSTLHVSYAHQVLSRMEDLHGSDVVRKLTSEMTGVVNQLLLPKSCPHCQITITADQVKEPYREFLEKNWKGEILRNTGCEKCEHRKSVGVVPVAEYIYFSDALKLKLRAARDVSEAEGILYKELQRTKSSLLHDGFLQMKNKNVTIDSLISKGVLNIILG